MITKITAVAYNPEARHPVFDNFLERVLPDDDLRGFVQRVAGYACTGSTAAEKLFLAHGPTAAGKSTLLTGLRRTLGDYAKTAAAETFMDSKVQGGAPRDDLVQVIGRRLVVSSEVKDGSKIAVTMVKTLFGGDDMSARGLYERTTEFTPIFKLIIAANHRPRARDDDDAFWRRIVEIPFTVSIPEDERDPAVKTAICDPTQSGEAILAWAVEGAAQWLEGGLREPKAVKTATAAYREAMDPLKGFLDECCVFEAGASITAGELRGMYEGWAKDNGIRFPLNNKVFADRLRGRGCESKRGSGGERQWRGLRKRGVYDPEPTTSDASDASDAKVGTSPYARAHEASLYHDVTDVSDVTHEQPCDCRECCPRDGL